MSSSDVLAICVFVSSAKVEKLADRRFEIVEGENQTRYYSWHTWGEELVEYNYTITGPARDLSNWTLTSTKEFDKTLMD